MLLIDIAFLKKGGGQIEKKCDSSGKRGNKRPEFGFYQSLREKYL